MAVVASNMISTFPSSMRTTDVYSRFTTERNLVNMVNGIVETDGYVKYFNSNTNAQEIGFVLGGYFFETTLTDILTALSLSNPTEGASIWAYAIVGYNSTGGNVGEKIGDSRLVGYNGSIQNTVDMGDYFIGVNFETSEPTAPASLDDTFEFYKLELVTFGTSWTVPDDSLMKFNTLTDSEIATIFDESEAEV